MKSVRLKELRLFESFWRLKIKRTGIHYTIQGKNKPERKGSQRWRPFTRFTDEKTFKVF